MPHDHITLNESPFDGALVLREDGEPVLVVATHAEGMVALAVARQWRREGRHISSRALEDAIRRHVDGTS